MRIADIEVFNLIYEYPNGKGFKYAGGVCTHRVTSLIKVSTEGGQEGWGSVYSHPGMVTLVADHVKPVLLGRDPRQVEELWHVMYGLTRWFGRKGGAMSTIGGIDTAFWDLKGQDAGQPLWKLFKGERNHVPAYASSLLWYDDVSDLEKEAIRHREKGFVRMKMRLGRNAEYDLAALDAAQKGAGKDGTVLVDGSLRYSLEGAERLGKILAKRGVFWFEEPFRPEDLDSYVRLRSRVNIPLAAGENEFGEQGFRELLRAGSIDIVQPDACRTGGLTECLRVAEIAKAYGANIATHSWSDALVIIANAHFIASQPHGLTVEVDQTDTPFVEELLGGPLEIKDGILKLPEGPGLGVKPDQAVIDRYAHPHGEPFPLGAYSDLTFGADYFTPAPPYGPPISALVV